MKILHIDLSEGFEDLSVKPNRYGGAQIVPSWYRELKNDFYSLADEKSFDSLKEDEKSYKCVPLSLEKSRAIRAGAPLDSVIGRDGFDLVFHGHCDVWVNTDIPTAIWVTGQQQKVHHKNKHLLLHSKQFQEPIILGNYVIHDVIIGKPVPIFQEYQKEDIVFQCTNHAPCFQSIQLARICRKYKIPLYLGGPISEGYPLMNEVDNKLIHYLGVMKYDDKIAMTKRARVHTLLHNFPINWTLSGMEALAYGCGLITTPIGFWRQFITPDIGRMITSEEEFVKAFEELKLVNQKDCHARADKYNVHNMVDSFESAFIAILKHEARRNL